MNNYLNNSFSTNSKQRGFFAWSLLTSVFILVVAALSVWYLFGTTVPIGYVGVRKIAFGPFQGLKEDGLSPGYQWTVPGYSTIYLVPQTVLTHHFDRATANIPSSSGALDIPTTDGTTVDVDVTLLIHFFPRPGEVNGKKHGGPSELIRTVGATEDQWRRYIAQIAELEIKRALSALSTVDFYDPARREARVKVAENNLAERLAPAGIGIDAVLVRRYTYREEIDQAIFKKNLQELEISYNKVAGDFAEAQRDVKQVESDGGVKIKNLDQQGLSEAEKIRSEGDLYRREKKAAADLLIAEARAEVDRLKSEVLARSGGDTYIAMQTAQVLSSLKGGVVSNVDPFDVDGWVKRLMANNSQANWTAGQHIVRPLGGQDQ